MTVRRADSETVAGVRTYYVGAESSETEYSVQVSHERVTCTCPDFMFRKQHTGQPCKHIREVAQVVTGTTHPEAGDVWGDGDTYREMWENILA